MVSVISAKGAFASGAKTVMVFGTFDGLHAGHLNFFCQAKRLGDRLIVVVARTKNVKLLKGKNPRFSELQRLESVKAAKAADRAILGQICDPYGVIRRLKPQIIALGYDQHSFDGNLKKLFPKIKIVRLKSYRPEIYKSSKLLHSQDKRTLKHENKKTK